MKAWPIDPLVFKSFKLEVSEKLQQGYLACGGQAFIARSLFDPLMTALPTNAKQNLSDCLPANRKRELGLDRRETG